MTKSKFVLFPALIHYYLSYCMSMARYFWYSISLSVIRTLYIILFHCMLKAEQVFFLWRLFFTVCLWQVTWFSGPIVFYSMLLAHGILWLQYNILLQCVCGRPCDFLCLLYTLCSLHFLQCACGRSRDFLCLL